MAERFYIPPRVFAGWLLLAALSWTVLLGLGWLIVQVMT